MTPFPLKIITPDGVCFEGQAESLTVRTTTGDMGILAGHINCVASLGMGRAAVVMEGKKRYGACIGGMVSVVNGQVTLLPTTFEWAEDIDLPRAQRAMEESKAVIADKSSAERDLRLAEARLKRALVRTSIAKPM